MYSSFYREKFNGIAVGRVARDRDFTSKLGFYHNEYQLQYIFDGERYFFVDGVCYRMTKGCLAIIDKKMIAKTCIIGGKYHDRLLVELEESIFEPLCELLGIDMQTFFTVHHGVYRVGDTDSFKKVIEVIRNVETEDKSDLRETKIKLAILEFFSEHNKWEKRKAAKLSEDGMKTHAEKQKRVHQVADYIAENYAHIDSVESLSKQFYMSNSYLSRIFKEVTNFTISEYINLCRIAASKMYLMNEKYSMTEIANILGYDSLTYFERVFKKQMEVTPFQYRKRITRHR
ncbi:helix-turn-helix transcriptional regulator [Butyrivibrio sp. INlla21]|uniref:helix-turn-helix transcriptional regulator n=1 Tax=Butyrivibrio sp. INlla21 TaxID=1520811 RepID=UPI0008EE1FC1|nr:AraC family transcriptional regulator [Butyrivibrio sp. INlla21]SFU52153.1 AraC-type DNA-binding protein [Butyrivibrio sp. INlla21]